MITGANDIGFMISLMQPQKLIASEFPASLEWRRSGRLEGHFAYHLKNWAAEECISLLGAVSESLER